jgi:hypothetical protein
MDELVCDLFISFFGDSFIKIVTWNMINYMGIWWPTLSSLQMSLLDDKFQWTYNIKINNFLIYESKIFVQFMETLKMLLTLQKTIEYENGTIKQTWLDEIKWFVCLFKLI